MKVKLGQVCTVVSGTTPKSGNPAYWDGDINWVTPAELTEDTDVVYETARKITELGVKESSLSPFPAGTVLLSSRAPIGKVAIAGVEMYCNQGFKNLICSDSIFNKYLFWFLKSKNEYLNSLGRGATFKEITKSIVEQIEIPLPDIDSQYNIAKILDKIANFIYLRKQQIAKLDELVKSRFVEMFGDPVSNPNNWKFIDIKTVIHSVTAGLSINGEARLPKTGEIAVLKVSAVTQGIFDPLECKTILEKNNITKYVHPMKGDLLFSRANTRELVGATCIVNDDYKNLILPDKLWKILFKQIVNVFYMKYILSSKALREQISSLSTGTSGSMYNISMKKFESLFIPLPPITLQNQFAAFVEQTEQTKSAIKQSLNQLETLKKAKMQEFFG